MWRIKPINPDFGRRYLSSLWKGLPRHLRQSGHWQVIPSLPSSNSSMHHNLASISSTPLTQFFLSNSSMASYYQNQRYLTKNLYLTQILNSIQNFQPLSPWNILLSWLPWAHSPVSSYLMATLSTSPLVAPLHLPDLKISGDSGMILRISCLLALNSGCNLSSFLGFIPPFCW